MFAGGRRVDAGRIDAGVPAYNRAVLGGEEENGVPRVHAIADVEVARARDVENGSRGCAGGAGWVAGGRDADDQCLGRAGRVVQRRHSRAVVGNPERAGAALGNTPGIDQVRVLKHCHAGQVRNEIGLQHVCIHQAAVFEGFKARASARESGAVLGAKHDYLQKGEGAEACWNAQPG
jgi:hypothetical protein